MIKLTVKQAVDVNNVLTAIKGANVLNFALSWHIEDVIERLQKHAVRAQEEHTKLLQEFGTLADEKSGRYEIAPEKAPDFNAAYIKLMSHQIEEEIKPFDREDFKALRVPQNVNIMTLKPFFSE